jgi:hypothetical protein
VTIASKPPPRVEPGDHDALLLFTTRRRMQDGVGVRMRMGVVVVVRAPGAVVRRLELGGMRVTRRGAVRVLELAVRNRGNVTEALARSQATLSLFQHGRRIGRLRPEARQLRPHTRGYLVFRYRGRARGSVVARVEVMPQGVGRSLRRAFPLRV